MITENDPAGMGIAFTNAINRYSPHRCRLITTATRYNFGFEKDLHLPDLDDEGFETVRDLLESADVLHFHILADEHIDIGPTKITDFIKGKRLLHHHHGHPHFRSNPEKYRAKYKRMGRKYLVSTPDLLQLAPEAVWQPNLVPIHDELYIPGQVSHNGPVSIGQSVTRKDLKDTKLLLQVVDEIRSQSLNGGIVTDIIEHTPHRDCLKRKNMCHVIFDHVQGYFGVSSLESLSQGKPVIAGLDDWNVRHIKAFTGAEELPWVTVRTPRALEKSLVSLINEREQRASVGRQSRAFMERYWTERDIIKPLCELYESL